MGLNEGYARYDISKGRFTINEFLGYNAHTSRSESEMSQMENLTSDEYPNLYQRQGRVQLELPEGMKNIQKIFRANGKLCAIADGKLWYDGAVKFEGLSEGDKSVAVCNGFICIMPDKVFYNYLDDVATESRRCWFFGNKDCEDNDRFICYNGRFYFYESCGEDHGDVELFSYINKNDELTFYDYKGSVIGRGIVTEVNSKDVLYTEEINTKEFSPAEVRITGKKDRFILDFCITYDSETITARRYFGSASSGQYFAQDAEKVKQHVSNVFFFFQRCGDFSVKGITVYDLKMDYESYHESADGSWVYSCNFEYTPVNEREYPIWIGDDYFDVMLPDIDYVCEKDNRIFGVCSGDNTLVASKLGEPLNFNYYPGTSLDSYSVDVGSDGEFTGISAYAGDVMLFKERYIHVLSGTKPSLFQLTGFEAFGVEKGSSESISVLCGKLYYKSSRGVMVFDGSYPSCISRCLGNGKYSDGVAGDDGRKYYISTKNESGDYELFVYDTDTGFWHREDSTRAVSMCEVGGVLYIATPDRIFGTSGISKEKVKWSAVFGPFDQYSENKKIVSSLSLRYKLTDGARFEIAVSFDGGEYEVLREIFYSSGTALECDIKLRRCNEFSVRLSGEGICRILGLSAVLREGTYSK